MLLCGCRISLVTTFYMQCVGKGTRLLMKLLMKYVTVTVLYSVENVSNLEIGHFFSLTTHGTTLFMIKKWTANSTNIRIIEKEIHSCIFKVNGV